VEVAASPPSAPPPQEAAPRQADEEEDSDDEKFYDGLPTDTEAEEAAAEQSRRLRRHRSLRCIVLLHEY
jgi:hypothetical protein